jgi:hypothetical protein
MKKELGGDPMIWKLRLTTRELRRALTPREVGTVGLGAVLLGFLVRLDKMPSGNLKDIKKP